MAAVKLGVTLYSFNAEYYSYQYSFEDCMALVASLGPGQGVEIVGPQMIRGFPQLPEEFERRFRTAVERHGLQPTAYGAYGDGQRVTGRWLTRDEQLDYLELQLRAAATLGFQVVRVQPSEAILTDLVPLAERLGVRMGIEIHAPASIEGIGDLIERVDRIDSAALGFIPDCGTFCHSCAQVYIDRFLELGVPERIVSEITAAWHARTPEQELRGRVDELGGDELAQLMVTEAIVYFGHSDPRAMLPLMPRIIHVHGKFYDISADGSDSAVRFPEVVQVLSEGGYDGFISCEYEGHHWYRGRNALEQITTLQSFIRSQIEAV
jgi:sugar phosphate isomerase/epimerase